MNRFHGIVLIGNTLLPAIVFLVLATTYVAILRPALDDLRMLRATLDRVDEAAADLRGFGRRIGTIGQLLDPPRRLYGGVQKLSEDFCGNVGKPDLWSSTRGRVQVASLGVIGEVTDRVGDTLGRLKDRGGQSADFARAGACKSTEVAFGKTFTVLAAVMAPFREIDLALGEFGQIYGALDLERSFPAFMRAARAVGTTMTVLGYLALALALWLALAYVSWAGARLQEGWRLLRR